MEASSHSAVNILRQAAGERGGKRFRKNSLRHLTLRFIWRIFLGRNSTHGELWRS